MKNLTVHPTFCLLMIAETLQGKYLLPVVTLATSILHEIGHSLSANRRGYALKSITIMPYGATISATERIEKKDVLPIALAGPVINIAVALLMISLWWIFPRLYSYTLDICRINLTVGLFNLLPVYPLDGSKILISLFKKPSKAVKITKRLGVILGVLFFILSLISLFFAPNYSLAIVGAMFFVSAKSESENERYRLIVEDVPFLKDFKRPITERVMLVSEDLKLIELVKHLTNNNIITFKVLNSSHEVVATISEERLSDLCLKHGYSFSLKEVVEIDNKYRLAVAKRQ